MVEDDTFVIINTDLTSLVLRKGKYLCPKTIFEDVYCLLLFKELLHLPMRNIFLRFFSNLKYEQAAKRQIKTSKYQEYKIPFNLPLELGTTDQNGEARQV